MHLTLIDDVVENWTPEARKVGFSKVLIRAFNRMQQILDVQNNKSINYTDRLVSQNVKYLLYSAHDTQTHNILRLLFPNINITEAPFSTNIFFEVYKTNDNQRYVQIVYDGQNLSLPDCNKKFISNDNFCELSEFLEVVSKKTILDRDILKS